MVVYFCKTIFYFSYNANNILPAMYNIFLPTQKVEGTHKIIISWLQFVFLFCHIGYDNDKKKHKVIKR